MLLEPSLHAKPWGGRRLATTLNKTLKTAEPYGESWELHDTAVVGNGAYAGQSLGQLLALLGTDLVGAGSDPAEGFPLLAKFLDANEWLSIQDHPDDEQARALEGEPRGKTEAWYIVAAEPGAQLVIGVQAGATREALAAAIRNNTLEQHLVYADVQAGDVLYMAAGAIHALGPGLVIYEIQQSSDTTYRLYDWGRMGLDGKPRALHIEKGLAVANLERLPEIRHTAGDESAVVDIVRSPFFYTVLHQLNARNGRSVALATDGRFHSLTCIEGAAVLQSAGGSTALAHGQTALLPAALGAYTLATNDHARVLLSAQP
jgi:mannose-6-phosphate isomerase